MSEKITGKSNNYVIYDVFEVYLEPIGSEENEAYFLGYTTDGNVMKERTQESIRGGIHNGEIAVFSIDEGVSFTTNTAIHYNEVLELQMGTKFKDVEDLEITEVTENEDGSFEAVKKKVAGSVLDIKSDAAPRNYRAQLRSIAYDVDSGEIAADVYWIFDKVQPDGNIEEMYTAAENKTQEITFRAQLPRGSKKYGTYSIVKRENDEGESGSND